MWTDTTHQSTGEPGISVVRPARNRRRQPLAKAGDARASRHGVGHDLPAAARLVTFCFFISRSFFLFVFSSRFAMHSLVVEAYFEIVGVDGLID